MTMRIKYVACNACCLRLNWLIRNALIINYLFGQIRTNPLTLAWNLFKWNLCRGRPPGTEWGNIGGSLIAADAADDEAAVAAKMSGKAAILQRWVPSSGTLAQRIYGFKLYMGMKRVAAAAARERSSCEASLVAELQTVHSLLLRHEAAITAGSADPLAAKLPPPLSRSGSVLRALRTLDGRLADLEPDQLASRLHAVKRDLQAAIEHSTEQMWEERRTQV